MNTPHPELTPYANPFSVPFSKYEWAYRLRRELRSAGLDLNKIFKISLEFLAREMPVTSASIFLADSNRDVWKEFVRLERDGSIAEGYRQEPMREGSAFQALLSGARDVLVTSYDDGEPLRHVFVRLDLPGESVANAAGPWIFSGSKNHAHHFAKSIGEFVVSSNADMDLLLLWCQEMGQWISLGLMDQKLDRQTEQIKAFGDLSWLFVTSLRLEDRLKLIIGGIQKLFGFDRLRLYLVDPEGNVLNGELETNIRREIVRLNHERYPLNTGEPRGLVEVLWSSLRLNSWSRILEYSLAHHDKMLYLPLKIQSKEIGVLVVDNLISQEPIPDEVRNLLQSFAGQLSMAVDNARLFSEVEKLSLYDALSHLPNRRYFDQRLQEELYRASRSNMPFSVCLIDLDFFKEINDTYGHQMGDQAIATLGSAVKNMLRQSDFAARWGGDEMAILLGNTGQQDALIVVERILNAIRSLRLVYPSDPPKTIPLTASMGISVYPQDGKDIPALIGAADRALYEVKFRGRDSFLFSSQIPEPSQPPVSNPS